MMVDIWKILANLGYKNGKNVQLIVKNMKNSQIVQCANQMIKLFPFASVNQPLINPRKTQEYVFIVLKTVWFVKIRLSA